MATAKRQLTNPSVQEPSETISVEKEGTPLGCTPREAKRLLREHNITRLGVGNEIAIDRAGFEAALSGQPDRNCMKAHRAIGAELALRTRAAQGLPAKISDPSVSASVVALVRSRDEAE
jgi:hypothetical protein